jgi:mono/diheme cytochrome c family protein
MVADNVFRSRCLRCHSNDFNSYQAVVANIGAIKDRALVRRDMPPDGPLSKNEMKYLQTWIDAGTPLNPGDGAAQAPVLEPNFESIRDLVFTPRCAKCHAPGEKHDDIAIFDYATLIGPDGWVTPGDPANSDLFEDLIKPSKGRMPPVKAGPALTSEQIEVIRTWIINGAPESAHP